MAEGIREHAQGAKRRINRIQIFNLLIEIAFNGCVECSDPRTLDQNLDKQCEEIEIFFRRDERKRVDSEVLGFAAHADVRAAKKLGEAFKTSAHIEDKGVGGIFLRT